MHSGQSISWVHYNQMFRKSDTYIFLFSNKFRAWNIHKMLVRIANWVGPGQTASS